MHIINLNSIFAYFLNIFLRLAREYYEVSAIDHGRYGIDKLGEITFRYE